MARKIKERIAAFGLAGVLTFSSLLGLNSCKNKKIENPENEKEGIEYVIEQESIDELRREIEVLKSQGKDYTEAEQLLFKTIIAFAINNTVEDYVRMDWEGYDANGIKTGQLTLLFGKKKSVCHYMYFENNLEGYELSDNNNWCRLDKLQNGEIEYSQSDEGGYYNLNEFLTSFEILEEDNYTISFDNNKQAYIFTYADENTEPDTSRATEIYLSEDNKVEKLMFDAVPDEYSSTTKKIYCFTEISRKEFNKQYKDIEQTVNDLSALTEGLTN